MQFRDWKTHVPGVFAADRQVLRPGGLFVFNVGGRFAGVRHDDEKAARTRPSLNGLIEQVAARDYGYTRPRPGIQDAVNLGWKLGFAVSCSGSRSAGGKGAEVLLDSYDTERRPAARRRLVLTHTAFWAEASTGRIPSWLRAVAAARAAPAVPVLLDRRRLVAEGMRLISQLRVNYRRSPLSVEGTPHLRLGWTRCSVPTSPSSG
ncbi:FAD-dependent monooxygenase [Streptomyces sp. 2A115]|uniref:FAD-dependent monooxygenase n=1 Tax=Streptomyces sp. 2A115 TaxID=3457439 RepID=UPI003FD4271B